MKQRQRYLFVISMQSDKDKLKYFTNLSPLVVLNISLLEKFVILTKKKDPKTAKKIPNCSDTRVSLSYLATVPKANTKLATIIKNSNHIELSLLSFICILN